MTYLYPEKFPENAKFAIYAGLPLTKIGDEYMAWGRYEGRPFYGDLFDSLSTPCTEAEFRQAVVDWKSKDQRIKAAKGIPVTLPKKFFEGTRFSDDEGTPLALYADQCTAWDRPGGRWYSSEVFFHRAYSCSEEEFRKLVAEVNVHRLAAKV